MEGFEGGGSRPAEEEEKFDASQYAFFGNDVVEEVELGGLEDEEEGLPPVGFDDEKYQLGREEGEALGSLSEIDDLSSTFSKFNKGDGAAIKSGFIGDREYREILQEFFMDCLGQIAAYSSGRFQDEGSFWLNDGCNEELQVLSWKCLFSMILEGLDISFLTLFMILSLYK